MNYFEYTELENIIGQKRAAAKHLKNNNILYGLKGAELNMISVIGKHFTPHWSQTVSPFLSALTQAPLMPIHNDESEPASTNWAQARLDSFSFLSDSPGGTQRSTSETPAVAAPTGSRAQRYKTVMTAFMNAGFNKIAAAALTGVAMSESGLKLAAVNNEEKAAGKSGYGIGLFQFSDARQRAFNAFTQGDYSLEKTVQFVVLEISKRKRLKEELLNATSLRDAVTAVHAGYTNGSEAGYADPDYLTRHYTKKWQELNAALKKKAYPDKYDFWEVDNKHYKHAQEAFQSI